MKEAECENEYKFLEYLNGREDVIGWFKNTFDESELVEFTKQHCDFDFAIIAEEVVLQDGRGHYINRYDGSEGKTEINRATYYIYRTN